MKEFLVHCKAFIAYLWRVKAPRLHAAKNSQEKLYNVMGFCLTLLVMLTACTGTESRKRVSQWEQWKKPNGKVKVLSTTAMINDIVVHVGGEHVDALVLINGELDPHSYQMVKGDDEKFLFADLVFYNGLGLEHSPNMRHFLETNPKAIGLGERLKQQYPDSILYYESQLDPHIWMDVSLWAKTISFVVDGLSTYDPKHSSAYANNGKILYQQFMNQHESIKSMMANVPENKRYLVTSHDAFHYFTLAYLAPEEEKQNDTWRKRFAAPEGLSPESQLSAMDIQMLIDHLVKYKIEIVFTESNVSQDSLCKIVHAGNEKGLKVGIANAALYADALGKPGSEGETYLKMIQYNAQTIQRFLNLGLSQETVP